jgi:D-glycero-alpha-D-manno-heptose 1-phosphate guanylyltransferase
MRNIRIQDIDVVVLCGGLGTRLHRVVDDRPKPMVEINGKPFLDILIEYIAHYDFIRFILCTGYKGDFIKRYYENKNGKWKFLISEEEEPLGTAGAIKNAESFIKSDILLVVNGDSLCEIDIKEFLKFHVRKRAFISIVLTSMENPVDFGVIRLNRDQKIISYSEKVPMSGDGFVNAGIYFFNRKVLKEIPSDEKLSLEYDIFPRILDKGAYGYVTKKVLLDIGTPRRLEIARGHLREIKE